MSKNILLVEDETSIRDLYAEFLASAGYQVDQAADGETALAKINEGVWDLLLLDIMLPRLDGLKVLTGIKENPSLAAKPIIIISNLEDQKVIDACLGAGAKEFLLKSNIVPGDLLTVVAKYFTPNDA